MKVLVLNNAVPFVWGGAEELAENLAKRLNDTKGVEAEVMRLPFAWEPAEQIVSEILLHRKLELINTDRVIALKFPAYLVRHPHKTLWVLHQFRQAYDLLEGGQSHLNLDQHGEIIGAIRSADEMSFSESRSIFVNSPVTRDRMRHFNNRDPEVLYPPLNDPELFFAGDHGSYIFAGGRVTRGKRQHLLVEAMKYVSAGSRLLVAGPCDDEEYAAELRDIIARNDLAEKVELRLELMSRETVGELMRNSLACAYIPYDEDSLGYVTMEAFASSKAVVTSDDSGGLLEIVKDGQTGHVVEPHPEALGAAFEKLFANRTSAVDLGKRAAKTWRDRDITWETTIARLLDG